MHTKSILALALAAALAAAPVSALAAPDKGFGMAIMSASIEANGARVRDAGVIDVDHGAPGAYRVYFNHSITACTCTASVG